MLFGIAARLRAIRLLVVVFGAIITVWLKTCKKKIGYPRDEQVKGVLRVIVGEPSKQSSQVSARLAIMQASVLYLAITVSVNEKRTELALCAFYRTT